jgi:hypothetical protein
MHSCDEEALVENAYAAQLLSDGRHAKPSVVTLKLLRQTVHLLLELRLAQLAMVFEAQYPSLVEYPVLQAIQKALVELARATA